MLLGPPYLREDAQGLQAAQGCEKQRPCYCQLCGLIFRAAGGTSLALECSSRTSIANMRHPLPLQLHVRSRYQHTKTNSRTQTGALGWDNTCVGGQLRNGCLLPAVAMPALRVRIDDAHKNNHSVDCSEALMELPRSTSPPSRRP